MTAAVSFDRVCFSYPDAGVPVLDDVTLEIPDGAFVLVTGPTGAGKSTLIRAMNGLVPHFTGGRFSGRVIVDGRNTLEHAPRELSDVVAFVPQDPSATFVLDTVEDELAYAMENLAMPGQVMRRRMEETLDLLDIEPLRHRSVRELSGGEKQRVAIGAALTPAPRVLLLDEPTSQLDPQGAEDVLAALQRLVHDLGMTVVIAEHRLERVAGFADVAIACAGGLVHMGSPVEILRPGDAGPPVAKLARLMGWEPVPLTVRDARRLASTLELGTPPPPNGSRAGEIMLQAREIEAGYGPRAVFEDVSFELRAGEIVAIVGRNGAGKTTLLRCLAGIHLPASGSVLFGTEPPLPGRDVAFLPQSSDSILFSETVEQEIQATVTASGRGVSPESYLDALGISALAAHHPRDCSAGERLLIAVAAIVATGAPLLLLDEPTRGLDATSKAHLAAFLRAWAGDGKGVIFSTHDVELVAEVSTRVVMIAGGEIVADGRPGEVLSNSATFSPQMTRVFGEGWLTPEQVATAAAR